MSITPIKENAISIIPRSWRKLIINKINLLIESENAGPIAASSIYKGLISQSGVPAANPTVEVSENTIGAIVWTYVSTGFYQGVLTGAFPYKNKVFFSCAETTNQYGANLSWGDANTVYFYQSTEATPNVGVDSVDSFSISIEVYP